MLIRTFDFIFSLIGLIVLSPILASICVVQKFSGEGEVFYLQERIGKNGKVFKILKFATMLKDSPRLGPAFTVRGDSRVLPLGKYLRRYKLNELPQLLNVLKGDLSLVGPRPFTPKVVELVQPPEQRSVCKPGVTSFSSIIFNDEESLISANVATEHFKKINDIKIRMDLLMIENLDPRTYMLALFSTVLVIFFRVSPDKLFNSFSVYNILTLDGLDELMVEYNDLINSLKEC